MKRDRGSLNYLFRVILFIIISLIIVGGINIYIDFYGLFRSHTGVKKYVYHNEMTTKYLLSYDYIPSNFNGILLGPSLSDNVNTANISNKDVRYYNASIMGANISELGKVLRNVVSKGDIKSVILCLHPYITKDFGDKSVKLDDKLYYSAFTSLNLYQSYAFYIIRKLQLFPNKYSTYQCTEYGTNDYNSSFKVSDIEAKINEEVEIHKGEKIEVNDQAFQELRNVIELLRDNHVKVSGYFHPLPQQILESNIEETRNYQKRVKELFDESELIIDFNSYEYESFRKDYDNYIDHGHLSKKGSNYIENKISERLSNPNY